jgi:hypothetical protein
MEIVVTPNTTYILSDYSTPRRICTDGRQWPSGPEALRSVMRMRDAAPAGLRSA